MTPPRVARVHAAALTALLLLAACAQADDVAGPDDPDAPEEGATPAEAEEADEEDGPDAGARVDVLRLAGGDRGFPSAFGYRRGPGWIFAGFTFDTLLWHDATGGSIPWLAEEWEHSDDGLEWTFTLHEDITWQDGEPLTAHDVAFTFEYITEGPGSEQRLPAGPELDVVDEVEATDDRTVVVRLPQPFADFEARFARRMLVVPEHVWAEVDDPAQYREDDALMGSGPYRLVDWDESTASYLYEANEDFFLGPPHVQRLEFVPAPDELLALERGEIHAAGHAFEGVPEEQVAVLEERFTTVERTGEWNLALNFHLDAGFPYDERDFRHAVAYAIDRQDMVDRLLFGNGRVGLTGGLGPANPWALEDLPDYARDLDQASALLDGLGITDENGDGWRQLPDGEPFEIELPLAAGNITGGELIAEYLREVGLLVELQALDGSTADDVHSGGNYAMGIVGHGGITNTDSMRQRLTPQEHPSFSVAHGFEHERFLELAEQQLVTVDEGERLAMVEEMQQIVADELPILSLYVPNQVAYYDPDVFDAWYYAPGCTPCGATRQKHMYVTGKQEGF